MKVNPHRWFDQLLKSNGGIETDFWPESTKSGGQRGGSSWDRCEGYGDIILRGKNTEYLCIALHKTQFVYCGLRIIKSNKKPYILIIHWLSCFLWNQIRVKVL
jgi:hypothetical protein